MGGSISQVQVDFFRRAGYIRITGQGALGHMKSVILKALHEVGDGVRSDSGRPYRVNDILFRDAIFWEVFTAASVVGPLESLRGPNIELFRQ